MLVVLFVFEVFACLVVCYDLPCWTVRVCLFIYLEWVCRRF